MSALDRLLKFPRFGEDKVIERMGKLVEPLSHTTWWTDQRCIKVVGSNGKGTTASMMAQMAQDLGKTVGLYTSPHILSPRERIKINGIDTSETAFENCLNWAIDQALSLEGVGRFEVLTLAALKQFSDENVDVAVMEIGLGGRFDPVKLAPGKIAALTSIDLEHTAILGDSFEAIAAEKCAVCKSGDQLFSAVTGVEECVPKGVELHDLSQPVLSVEQSNARLAAHALKAHLKLEDLPEISFFKMCGRFQKVSQNPIVYVDVAHSPAAVRAVLKKIKTDKIGLICAARNDKDIVTMAQETTGRLSKIIALKLEEDMSEPCEILSAFSGVSGHEAGNLKEALSYFDEGDTVLCLGGFTIVAHTLAHYNNHQVDKLVRI